MNLAVLGFFSQLGGHAGELLVIWERLHAMRLSSGCYQTPSHLFMALGREGRSVPPQLQPPNQTEVSSRASCSVKPKAKLPSKAWHDLCECQRQGTGQFET